MSWEYKPTRWGMYDVLVLSPSGARPDETLKVEIGGKKLSAQDGEAQVRDGLQLRLFSRFYLSKSDPFMVRVGSSQSDALKNIKAILLRPAPEGRPIIQENENILLHARDATTLSVMMRYEPATNKNCLGYWTNPSDKAQWRFEVKNPGRYEIELWQGCGKGQGGSQVAIEIVQLPPTLISSQGGPIKKAEFTVEDTGHFQNFIPRNLGQVSFPAPGPYYFLVEPLKKKASAIMDIRQIVLKRLPDASHP